MFRHIFSYRFKKLLRTKEMIFWTLAFPILLSIFFHMAFQNLDAAETFQTIPTGVLADEAYEDHAFLKEVLLEVSKGSTPLLQVFEGSQEELARLLEEGTIRGYLTAGDPISLTVRGTGMSENILRLFLEELNEQAHVMKTVQEKDPASVPRLLTAIEESSALLVEKEKDTAAPSQILNYFYSLIAMACMYGAFFGSDEITDIEAHISSRAARIQVAPLHKLKAFLSSSLASYVVLMINTSLLLLFLRFVLGIDFGPRVGYLILTTFMGTFTGLTFGAFISTLVKKNENMKSAVIVAVTMAGSFLSGMMYAPMKYIVYDKAPVVFYLNPVNLITDSFFSLYYYSSFTRYAQNMGMLLLLSILFSLGSYTQLRRRRYASI